MVTIFLLISMNSAALDSTTLDITLGPGEYGGGPVVGYDTDSIEMKVESDKPVDVYIIDQEEYVLLNLSDFEYREKWEGQTNLNVDYQLPDQEMAYYILIINPSETETANVDLEYKLFEGIAEDVAEDVAKEACCGMTILASIALIAGILLISIYVSRRR
jgi:hypothetical protein